MKYIHYQQFDKKEAVSRFSKKKKEPYFLGDIKLSGGTISNKFALLPSKKSGQHFVNSYKANGCILMGFFVFDHEFRLG
jgi:hypothetical protein